MRRSIPISCGVILLAVGRPLFADGLHLGWCIGVGNKHANSACAAGTQHVEPPQGPLPVVNQYLGPPKGPTPKPTPQTVIVPGNTPPQVVEPQQPKPPQVQSVVPQITPQFVPRPQPILVPQPVLPPQRVPPLQPPLRPPLVPAKEPIAVPQPQLPPQLEPPLQPPLRPPMVPAKEPIAVPQPQLPPQLEPPLQPPLRPPLVPAKEPIAVPQPQLPPQIEPPLQPPLAVVTPHSPRPVTSVNPPGTTTTPSRPDARPDSNLATVTRPPGGQVHGGDWIVLLPGRQPPHALPERIEAADGSTVHCVASGFGWRRQQIEDGNWQLIGVHAHLRTTDILVRDIPANRHSHAGCVLEVVRRIKR